MSYRIEPAEGADITPPCGGRWLRDPDGGLRPADAATADAAGLAWRGEDDEPDDL